MTLISFCLSWLTFYFILYQLQYLPSLELSLQSCAARVERGRRIASRPQRRMGRRNLWRRCYSLEGNPRIQPERVLCGSGAVELQRKQEGHSEGSHCIHFQSTEDAQAQENLTRSQSLMISNSPFQSVKPTQDLHFSLMRLFIIWVVVIMILNLICIVS